MSEPNTLDTIWKLQDEQQRLWYSLENLTDAERAGFIRELLLHLHSEVDSLASLMDQSKYHILKRHTGDEFHGHANLAEAGVDVLKLLVALMQLGNVTWREFAQAFVHKTQVVESKWRWQRDDLTSTEVLLCDIDGCIGDYIKAFNRWLARAGITQASSVNHPSLEGVKDAFHSGGGFRDMEVIPGSIPTLNAWRAAQDNRRLVLVTARPYKRYRRIYSDTVHWCNENGLKFDHVLFEHDKAEAVRQVQPATVVAHIEDRAKHALEVAHTGVRVFKLPFHEAEEHVQHPNIITVGGWADIKTRLGE